APADHRRRAEPARSRSGARGGLRLRGGGAAELAVRRAPGDERAGAGSRAPTLGSGVEAIILAGGKAERLGDAAEGRPKALVPVGGKPLIGYQVARLAAAGVARVIVGCAAGKGEVFARELPGLGLGVAPGEEPAPLGR